MVSLKAQYNWYSTYVSHLKKTIQLICAEHGSCFLLLDEGPKERCTGIILPQVYDSLKFGTKEFHDSDEKESARIENHGASIISAMLINNAMKISLAEQIYHLHQSDIIRNVKSINSFLNDNDALDFFAQRTLRRHNSHLLSAQTFYGLQLSYLKLLGTSSLLGRGSHSTNFCHI